MIRVKFGKVLFRSLAHKEKRRGRKKRLDRPSTKPRAAPTGQAYHIYKYVEDRGRVEAILDKSRMDLFNYHMDIMEAFMCHCKPEGAEPISQVLVLVMTAYLCVEGKDSAFPNSFLTDVLNEASAVLCKEICKNALSNEFEKIALFSAHTILTLFKTIVTTKLSEVG